MADELELARIREVFANDRFATVCAGATIEEVEGDTAVCSMEIVENHLNASGSVMGGAIFTLADFAFAVASNHQGVLTVTVSSTIEFMGTPKDRRLVARAVPDKVGRSMCYYTVEISDGQGNIVSKVVCTGKRTSVKIG